MGGREYFGAMLKGARVPNLEMHIYGNWVHGNGLKDREGAPLGTWQDRFVDWFRDLGFLGKPGVETKAARDVAAHVTPPGAPSSWRLPQRGWRAAAVRRRGPAGQRIQGVSRIFAPRVVSILTAFAGEASGRANVTGYWAVMLLAILASIASRPVGSTALKRIPPLAWLTALKRSSRVAGDSPVPRTETDHSVAPDFRTSSATFFIDDDELPSGELKSTVTITRRGVCFSPNLALAVVKVADGGAARRGRPPGRGGRVGGTERAARAEAGRNRYAIGAQLLAAHQTSAALRHLRQAQAQDPQSPAVAYALGQALRADGQAAEAVPHLRRGFDAGIELPRGGLDFPLALRAAGDNAGALAAIRRLPPPDSDPDAALQAGRLATELGAPEVAEPFFRRAAALAPAQAAVRLQYGLNLLVLHRCEAAVRELGEAVRLDPRDADGLARLSYCELELGRTADARVHAAAALALNPGDPLRRSCSPRSTRPR